MIVYEKGLFCFCVVNIIFNKLFRAAVNNGLEEKVYTKRIT